MKQPSLEETLVNKINGAKVATQEKLFKQFCKANTEFDRNDIGSMMNVLDKLTFELIKNIRGNLD